MQLYQSPVEYKPKRNANEHDPSLCFYQLRLLEGASYAVNADFESPPGISLNELQELSGFSPEKFILQFESLGEDCEFGVVQRSCGAEPLGLLSFGAPRLKRLVECIRSRFENIGAPENIEIRKSAGSPPEYFVHETYVDMAYHTWQYEGQVDKNSLHSKQVVRLPFLARKLMEDLSDAAKIFVWKSSDKPTIEPEVQPLHEAMNQFGQNILLWVVLAEPAKPSGTVEILRSGLLKGYIHSFSSNFPDVELEPWLQVCVNAHRITKAYLPASGYHGKPAALGQ